MPAPRSFFLCATPRSGSSLLSEALEFTGIAGRPREYFEPVYESDWCARLGISDDNQYVEKLIEAGTTPNGVFGAKLHWHQFVHLTTKLRQIPNGDVPDRETLARTFPGLRYIFLTRRDKVLQAVSYVKALCTNRWHSLDPAWEGMGTRDAQTPAPAPETVPAPSFSFEEIDRWVTRFVEDERRWWSHFERGGVEPFEVVYEEFLEHYEATVLAILCFLEIPIPDGLKVTPPRLRKLGDETSEEWARQYRTLKRPARPLRGAAKVSYFLCTTPRTGGFLLAEGLESTRVAGRPREYFDRAFRQDWCAKMEVHSDAEYLAQVLAAGTTPNGVFGAKVLWHQLEQLLVQLRSIQGNELSDRDLLDITFPGLRYVLLTRRDKLRQAISYDRAIRSGVWWLIAPNPDKLGPPAALSPAPAFAFDQIDHWVTRLTAFESHWRRHFQRTGAQPFEIAYEDLTENYEGTVQAVLNHLGLPLSEACNVAPPRLRKQADDLTEEWVDRYLQLKR